MVASVLLILRPIIYVEIVLNQKRKVNGFIVLTRNPFSQNPI